MLPKYEQCHFASLLETIEHYTSSSGRRQAHSKAPCEVVLCKMLYTKLIGGALDSTLLSMEPSSGMGKEPYNDPDMPHAA